MKKDIKGEAPMDLAADLQCYDAVVIESAVCPATDLLHELRTHLIELEMQNEALRRAHAALETYRDPIYDVAAVGCLILTHEGLIAEINLAAADFLGVDHQELLTRRFTEFVAPQDGDGWQYFLSGAIRHNQRQAIALTLKRYDGGELPVYLDCRCEMSGNQNARLRVTLSDLTLHKQSQTTYCEFTMTTDMILASAGLASWDWDIKSERGIVNECWAKLRGYRLEDIDPNLNTWKNGIHPDDLSSYYAALTGHLENRTAFFQAEYRTRTLSGSWIWLLGHGVVIKRDTNGYPLRIAGIEMDITERRFNEEQLRIAAAAFESQEGIFITDTNAVIMRVNQAFTRMTGYSDLESVGQTPRLLNSGRHNKAFYQCMWNTLKDKGCWQGEIWSRHKDGMIYNVWLNIFSVSAIDGSIGCYVASFSDITTNKDAAAKIHNLAYYDPLTLLPNRRLFQDRLGKAIAISNRSRKYGALLFIDLDNFKALNDTLGHDMGDLLLTQVGMRLAGCIREGDTVARQGGDEFVVILEALSINAMEAANQTGVVGEKILTALNQIYQLSHHEYHSTPSIGITLFNNKESVEELLKRVDIAMYAAKAAGRNTLRFFEPKMQAAVTDRVTLEMDLQCALTNNQLKLYFQLQAQHDRKVIGAEVLLRWEHPGRGFVSPSEFIPLAEETRLILPIGLWVLDSACAQLKKWESIPQTRHLQLAVNVSAHQFHQACFVEQVCAMLKKYAISADRLKLELTESLVLDNIDDTIIKMQELKEVGVHFSMDDFGTGYSSLAYLTQLPLNQLKIDQSFVRNIGVKPTDAVIVQTIIGMANNLCMEVIAEGVETEEQRAFLEQYGCSAIQGYLFGRPLPLDQFEQSLGIQGKNNSAAASGFEAK